MNTSTTEMGREAGGGLRPSAPRNASLDLGRLSVIEKAADEAHAVWKTTHDAANKLSGACFDVIREMEVLERMRSNITPAEHQTLERLRQQHGDLVRKHDAAKGEAADAEERYRAARKLADSCAAALGRA